MTYRETNLHINGVETCLKTRVLTSCCFAGSGEESVMEEVKRDKRVHKVDGHRYMKQEYLLSVVVQVVVNKVSSRA